MSRLVKIGLGVGFLWYAVLRGAKGLVVKVKSFSFHSIDPAAMTVSLNLNLLVKNPLIVGLTIKGVQGKVYAQGHEVGNVDTAYNYHIAGGKTHILPVIVNLAMQSVGEAAWLNIQSGDIKSLTIAFDGYVFVGDSGVRIPLQFAFDYNDLVK